MNEQEERALAAQIDTALPAVLSLPVSVGYTFAPVVWVDSHRRPDVQVLQARLASVGEHFGQLNEFELRRIYGKIEVRWIYAFGKQTNAFFLWARIQVPSFERPFVRLPALQVELAFSFNVDDPPTVALLRSLADCRSMFVQFAEVPDWVRQLPPLSSDRRRAHDLGKRGQALIRSSLPLEFRPDVVERMEVQLEQWLGRSSP
jgi:hypothetical protein